MGHETVAMKSQQQQPPRSSGGRTWLPGCGHDDTSARLFPAIRLRKTTIDLHPKRMFNFMSRKM